MKSITMTDRLDFLAKNGIYVYSSKMLKSYFPGETKFSLKKTIERLVSNGLLERVCRATYMYTRYSDQCIYKLETIAASLRAGEYSYISLESALSEYSIISQMMLSHLTVMTTGRSQTYITSYGTIEFTHTSRDEIDIISNTSLQDGRPLRIALPEFAYKDLKRVKRNLHMVSIHILEEILDEKNSAVG